MRVEAAPCDVPANYRLPFSNRSPSQKPGMCIFMPWCLLECVHETDAPGLCHAPRRPRQPQHCASKVHGFLWRGQQGRAGPEARAQKLWYALYEGQSLGSAFFWCRKLAPCLGTAWPVRFTGPAQWHRWRCARRLAFEDGLTCFGSAGWLWPSPFTTTSMRVQTHIIIFCEHRAPLKIKDRAQKLFTNSREPTILGN